MLSRISRNLNDWIFSFLLAALVCAVAPVSAVATAVASAKPKANDAAPEVAELRTGETEAESVVAEQGAADQAADEDEEEPEEAETTSDSDETEADDDEADDDEADDDEADDDEADDSESSSEVKDEKNAADEDADDEKAGDDKATEQDDENVEEADAKKKSSAKDKKKDEPKPHTVERKPLKIKEELSGIFVAAEMEEISLRPEVWSRFTVEEAVEHGTKVRKGDMLVRFDDEQIEQELAKEAISQRLDEISVMLAEEELPRSEKLLELKYQQAKRRYDQLREDRDYYFETDRPFAERIAKYRYRAAEEGLESQREELAQLKKMYEADDITEETETIVLRRQEFQVQTAELVLELQTASRDYTLNVTLPRNDETYETTLEEARIALEQAETMKEMGTSRGKFELEKTRQERARSVERHAKLLGDRDLMVLKAPTDGVVYYGRCINGQWAEINSMTSKLSPFSSVSPNTVLMTIVKQEPLEVLSSVSEKSLPHFEVGQEAQIIPASDEDQYLSGKVTKIVPVPGGNKKFDVHLEMDDEDALDWLVAGMTCNVKVTTYDQDDVVVVPLDMVQTDEDDERVKYVMLLEEDEKKPVRREVKLGRRKEKLVEVLEGLDEGDKIVKEEKDDEEDESDE